MLSLPARRALPLIISIVLLHVTGFALTVIIFYPGVMTYDAKYIYLEIATGRFGDWQSPVMGWLWSLVDPIAPGPGSIFLVAAASYWIGFALLSLTLARRSGWLALITPLLALSPPAFFFVGMIWRDVLFTCAWLLAAVIAFAAAESRASVRVPAQLIALGLLVFGVLLRPNAILAAPILAAYVAWPQRFGLGRAAAFFLPTVVALILVIHIVYYGIFDATRQKPWASILVFDLGGITHFTKTNQFPVAWDARETALLADHCYRPALWNVYWNADPCRFVMHRLEREKIFGSHALVEAWLRAVLRHPLAYLRHRAAFMWTFLTDAHLTMWTHELGHQAAPIRPDGPVFTALKSVDAALAHTPLFRAGTWLLLNAAIFAWGWRKRCMPGGAFALAVSGSAVAYVGTFLFVGVASEFRYALWAVVAGLTGALASIGQAPQHEYETDPRLVVKSLI